MTPSKKEMNAGSFEILPSSMGLPTPGKEPAVVRNLPANAGDAGDSGSIFEPGRSPGVGHGNPLHYSCLENSTDKGACPATVHRVVNLRIEHTEQLSTNITSSMSPSVIGQRIISKKKSNS